MAGASPSTSGPASLRPFPPLCTSSSPPSNFPSSLGTRQAPASGPSLQAAFPGTLPLPTPQSSLVAPPRASHRTLFFPLASSMCSDGQFPCCPRLSTPGLRVGARPTIHSPGPYTGPHQERPSPFLPSSLLPLSSLLPSLISSGPLLQSPSTLSPSSISSSPVA